MGSSHRKAFSYTGRQKCEERASTSTSVSQTARKSSKAITLLTCIRQLLGSNPDPDISYYDWGFHGWFLVLPGKYQNSASIRTQQLFAKSSSIYYSPIIVPFDAVQCGMRIVSYEIKRKMHVQSGTRTRIPVFWVLQDHMRDILDRSWFVSHGNCDDRGRLLFTV